MDSLDKGQGTLFDVVIVGGGPAGATCANALQLGGMHSVALVDREHFPRDKSCGDGIGPGAVEMLRKIGLAHVLDDHHPITHLSVSSPSKIRVSGPLPQIGFSIPRGYTIPRKTFDAYLAAAAEERGAHCFFGWKVKDANRGDGVWNVTLTNVADGETLNISCKVLVGADGARSRVRKLLGVRENVDRRTGIAVRVYAQSEAPKLRNLTIDFSKELLPAYGWVFPINANSANIGVGVDLDNYKRRKVHLRELFGIYAGNFDFQYDMDSYNSSILPYWSNVPLAFPNVGAALVGDAASMVNPLTGEGIFYGMYAGELLASCLIEAKAAGGGEAGALSLYAERFRNKFEKHFMLNWRMKEKVSNPMLCDTVIKACSRDRRVLSDLIDMMMGDKRDMGTSTIFRILVSSIF